VGCCNKDWNLKELPETDNFSGYTEIMLTGGEPLLRPEFVKQTVRQIRNQTNTKIYLYTAKTDNTADFLSVLNDINGICLTLHEQKDVETFKKLNLKMETQNKSLRLNIFEGIDIEGIDLSKWIVKSDIKWIKNCPLPLDEVFMRLKG
jgi:pyruvate formate-lyase activating enzyme-like uncharacterized protein